MSAWQVFLSSCVVIGGPAALYGLHRLALWMEERGYLYYLHKKPSGGNAAGCFVAIQKVVEPQVQHVFLVKEEAHREAANPAGPGDDPGATEARNLP